MSAVDSFIADLRAQKISGRQQMVFVLVDDFVACLVTLQSPSGAAGGDLGGNYPNPSVVAIQGQPVSANAPLNGQTLTFTGGNWVGQ